MKVGKYTLSILIISLTLTPVSVFAQFDNFEDSIETISTQLKNFFYNSQTAIEQLGNFPVPTETDFAKYLDYDIWTVSSLTVDGKRYHIKQISSYIPALNGIEVYDSNGNPITDNYTIRRVFEIAGWIEAGKQYSNSDLNTLKNILDFSNQINSAIAPINSDINSVLQAVDVLQNDLCIDLIIFRGCAWDLVEYQVPGISTVESVVRTLNSELTRWNQATSLVNREIPSTISTIEDLKFNQQVRNNIEGELRDGISALGQLRTTSSDLSSNLSQISGILSGIEQGLYEGSDFPLIGGTIRDIAEFFGDLKSEVLDFRNNVNQVSSTLSSQSQKLKQLISNADRESDELFNSWSSRQNALPMWNMIIIAGGFVILILIIVIPIAVVRRKRK